MKVHILRGKEIKKSTIDDEHITKYIKRAISIHLAKRDIAMLTPIQRDKHLIN